MEVGDHLVELATAGRLLVDRQPASLARAASWPWAGTPASSASRTSTTSCWTARPARRSGGTGPPPPAYRCRRPPTVTSSDCSATPTATPQRPTSAGRDPAARQRLPERAARHLRRLLADRRQRVAVHLRPRPDHRDLHRPAVPGQDRHDARSDPGQQVLAAHYCEGVRRPGGPPSTPAS